MGSSTAAAIDFPIANEREALHLILERYERELHACRQGIAQRLVGAPHARRLIPYFQRGKMIRPVLVFLAAEACGVSASEVIPAAESMELLHVAALIHDDIMDHAEERRGLPSLHCQIGLPAAIVVGDYLILQAFETLTQNATTDNSGNTLQAVRHLASYAQECCKGQIQELMPASDKCTEQEYFSVVRRKTASQFAAAVSIGAIFGDSGAERLARIRAFGVNTGIVFQIRDDELDLTGDSRLMGKPTGNSIENGKPFLPFIYLREHCFPDGWEQLLHLRQRGYPKDEVLALLRDNAVLAQVDCVKKRFLSHALAELDHLESGPERETLRAIAIYAASRSS